MASEVLNELLKTGDPVERELAIALREWQAEKERNGLPRSLGYEPKDIRSKGAVAVIEARVLKASSGFGEIEPKWTYEAIVCRHPSRFRAEVVDAAKRRLDTHRDLTIHIGEDELPDDAPNTKGRNPNWIRDELILALDLYVRFKGNPPDKASAEIVGLSQTLNKLSQQASNQSTFRNPNGVYMKIMNFRRFDPEYTSTGRKGLERGSKLEGEIWAEFADDPERLRLVAQQIVDVIASGEVSDSALEDDDETAEASEGRLVTRLHRQRERSGKLVKKKKAQALKRDGVLVCEACGFDFEKHYGEHGRGYIEAHHIKPVHTLSAGSKTTLDDLALLCSNCHRMVHASRPWLEVQELKKLLDDRR